MVRELTVTVPSAIREHRTVLSIKRHYSGGCFVAFRYLFTPAWGNLGFDVTGANLPADHERWLGAVKLGAREQVEYWAQEGTELVGVLLVVEFKVHATDTNRAICEEAGRRVVDELVEWLSG